MNPIPARTNRIGIMNFSRRGLLRFGMVAGAGQVFRVSADSSACSERAVCLLEVPASASGIHWVHENAMSPSRFLPEALGPGCAFLDYDNDGWMDIYLVNSGPSDFCKPSQAAAQCALQEQSRRHVHRCHGKGRRRRRHLRHGRGRRAITTTTAGPTCSSPPTATASSTRTITTEPSPT